MRIVELILDDEEITGIEAISVVENPAIVATPATLAKDEIPAVSENVAKPALLASVARIDVEIVPVVNHVIITLLPMNMTMMTFL